MVLTLSFVLSPGNRAFLPLSLARSSSRALDTSVGVSGPHDFAVCIDIVRPRAQSVLRCQCIHRIPASRVVTIARTSLFIEAGWQDKITFFWKTEYKYFCVPDWTGESALNRLTNFDHPRMRFSRSVSGAMR
jgi:hypothetical protein